MSARFTPDAEISEKCIQSFHTRMFLYLWFQSMPFKLICSIHQPENNAKNECNKRLEKLLHNTKLKKKYTWSTSEEKQVYEEEYLLSYIEPIV